MRISELQEPYKTLAKFFKREKTDVLSQAFNWGDCTGKTVESHIKFWNAVNQGKKPLIPRGILNYREKHLYPGKHSGKKLPVVMGMPKNFSEKTKLIPVKKVKPTESYDHLLDKKMKGFDFKFDTVNTSLPYVEQMDNYIGKIGTIIAVLGDIVEVKFDDITWMYPSYLAKDHLVEDDTLEDLIGRKMTAFPFTSGINGVEYHKSMDDVIGHDGTIVDVTYDAVFLSFRRINGDIYFWYPFGKEVKSFATGRSAEEYLIPEEEVQEILDAMPEDPFIVGQTVYFRGNGGQYKCTVTRADFSGPAPITIDPGKPLSVWSTTVDGRSLPEKYPSLSHIPWCDVNGVQLEMLNAEPEEPIRTKDQIIAALEKDLDDAYKNEEAMLKELNTNLDRILFHCHSVQENTGNVTIDDITYCTILVRRVMENKFGYKPKQEEV
jgi:hypothetical protein